MYIVFTDECGFSLKWQEDISQQPYYILAGILLNCDQIPIIYQKIRDELKNANLPIDKDPLKIGMGQEIKAKDVDSGAGHWADKNIRDTLRALFLNPPSCDATIIAICVDKEKHKARYRTPEEPDILAFQFFIERIQGFLNEKNDYAFMLCDKSHRESQIRTEHSDLYREGSRGFRLGVFGLYEWHLKIDRILEVQFGDSRFSLGLHMADFVARHIYSWRKKGKDPNYPGWNLIEHKLYRYPNYIGWGYKEFPEE